MNTKEYKTRDIFEASALALTVKPIRLDKAMDSKDYLFVFDYKKVEFIANDYWIGKLTGNIREYAKSLKAMKDWIFSERRKTE